jgi:hypothetical protein
VSSHPAIYYAKFYLSRRSHTYDGVAQLLSIIGLGGLNADELERIDKTMDYPNPFLPNNLRDRPSQAFLRYERIYDAWHPGEDMRKVLSILETSKLRHLVETYILSPIKPDQAIKKITKQFPDSGITVKSYELFQHYFWNREVMSGVEWGKFIDDRDQSNKEWLDLAVKVRGPCGVQALLWKTNSGPLRGIEANRAFTDVRNISFMCVQQIAMQRPSKYHSEMMLNYTRAMKMAQEGIDASADAVRDVAHAFNSFRMKHDEINAPSVQLLTGGNFSEAEGGPDSEERLDYDDV